MLKSFLAWLRHLAASSVVRLLFLLLSLLFLWFVLRDQWYALRDFEFHLRMTFLIASYALLGASWLLEVSLWRYLLRIVGFNLGLRRAASIWFLSNLARYIPGNVWQFLGMMELAATDNIPRSVTMMSIVLHQVFSLSGGLVVGIYSLQASLNPELAPGAVLVLASVFIPTLFALSTLMPRLLERSVRANIAATTMRRFSRRNSIALFLGYCVYWLLFGTGFAVFALALGTVDGQALPRWMSAYSAAYVAGYLSLLTPSGLGVREGIIVLLLAPTTAPGSAAIASLGARLWVTLGEIGASVIAIAADTNLLLRKRST